jgi:hypothetical protein
MSTTLAQFELLFIIRFHLVSFVIFALKLFSSTWMRSMVAGVFGAESSFIDGMNHCNSVPNKGFHMMDAPIRGAWHRSFK